MEDNVPLNDTAKTYILFLEHTERKYVFVGS